MAITTRSGKGSELTYSEMDDNLNQIPNGSDSSITDSGNGTVVVDSSGNLLVGTTTSEGTGGVTLKTDGGIYASRTGTHFLNRESTDGDILRFQKDGTTVGSISAKSGDMILGTDDTGVRFNNDVDSIYPVNASTRVSRDASIDLGYSAYRFKDIYLSGGVYVGGTGSANYLDDYEEGTWTPTDGSGAGLTFGSNTSNWYVKVGNLVTIGFDVSFPSTSNTNGVRISLPFSMESNYRSGGIINWSQTGGNDAIHGFPSLMSITYNGNSGRTNAEYSGDRIIGSITYKTT